MAIDSNILEQIRKNDPGLIELELVSKNIDDNDVVALAGALKGNRTLTRLDLEKNSIGDVGAIALAGALKDNCTLTRLNLWGSSISRDVQQALVDTLIINKNITFVELTATNSESYVKLIERSKENKAIAIELIQKIRSDPEGLTRDDRQEIQDRISAIVEMGKREFKFSRDNVLEMLADIGIKPAPGPATQRVNAVREAQRKAALEDPSQGI